MRRIFAFVVFSALFAVFAVAAWADVRVKQRVTMGGQSMETTRSIKGSRERTETRIEVADPQAAAFMPQISTITQCDLKRTVKLNDRKRLYMLEPFPTTAEAAPVSRTTPERPTANTTRRGGTMTITSNLRDTGERKTMFGLQARRLVMTQEMETSADSCNGPSKTKMEFDGWYVDFSAEFSCPIARPEVPVTEGLGRADCTNRIIIRGSAAAARPGFLLQGTMKMFGKDGAVQMTSTTETIELSRSPLDASLFDIPAGYQETTSQQELYAVSMPTMGDVVRGTPRTEVNRSQPNAKSVALNVTYSSVPSAARAEIDQYLRDRIASRGYRTANGTGDYVLNVEVRQVKESATGKVGGLFGKVTGIETKVGKVDIDMSARLTGGASGQAAVKNKFDGPLTDAIRTALDQLLDQAFRGL